MKPNFMYRLIWFGCLSVCIPIVLAGAAYYQFSINNGIERFQDNNRLTLGMLEQYTEKLMSDIMDDSFQLAFDPVIVDSFVSSAYSTDYVEQMKLLDKLELQKHKNDYIGDIYYYNDDARLVLSNEYGYVRLQDYKHNRDIAAAMETDTNAQWSYLPESSKRGYFSFALKLPMLSSDAARGMLVTEMDANRMKRYFNDLLALTEGQSVFVFDKNRRLMFEAGETDHLRSVVDSAIYRVAETADGSAAGSGSVSTIKGDKLYYSYAESTAGNLYFSVTPRSVLNGQLSWIRWVTFVAVMALILFGILLTIVTLKRAYNPIGQLVDYLNNETKSMKERWIQSVPPLMERVLQQWLGGNYIHSSSLYDECRKYGIPLDRDYLVLLVKPENTGRDSRFRQEDQPVLTFAVLNVMRELLNATPNLQGYVLHDQHHHGTAILHFDRLDGHDSMIERAKQFAASASDALEHYLKLQVSVGIGRIYAHIADIRQSYRDSRLALQHRMYKEGEHILYIAMLETSHKQSSFAYPRAIETQIVEALVKGDAPAAQSAMEAFSFALKPSESYFISFQSYYMLLASIISSIEHKGGGIPDMLEYDLFDQLRRRETPAEMREWFVDTVFPLYVKIADDDYSTAGRHAVKSIRKYVMDHLSQDLSLTECADRFQISPSYLSRLFKKEVGLSFLDFVTECKINKARQLLTETDQNISQIAGAVGYSHRSFNRVFQRMLNMSPSDYRMHHR